MKKIIILLLLIFLSGGCYDYVELNDLAIISGISIDKKDDEFIVVYEILNTVNKEDNPNEDKVYFTKGSAKTISEAFLNVSYEVPKVSYTAHIDTIIISEEIAKNNLEEIIDFLIRDVDVRNQFYLVIATNFSSEDILRTTSTTDPIASTAIKNLIEELSNKRNITSSLNYEEFLAYILEERKEGYLTTITKNDDILEIGPLAIFNKYNMQTILNNKNSSNFNILNNSSHENIYKTTCPDNDAENMVLITSIPASTEIKFENNNVNLNIKMEVRVAENHCNINFRNTNDLEKIENKLSKEIEKEMDDFIKEIIKYDSDILGISNKYYQKNHKDTDFKNLNYKTKVDVLINRNGLIFEVEK